MYSSQRALSFLSELKRNEFAWDILNQSHSFSMFWKNALTSDICCLNKTFHLYPYDVVNREVVFTCSLVRGRSLVMFSLLLLCVSHLWWRRSCHTRVVRALVWFLGLITVHCSTLVSRLWRNSCKHWRGFSTERRVKKRVLSGMSSFRISSMKNDRSTPLSITVKGTIGEVQ